MPVSDGTWLETPSRRTLRTGRGVSERRTSWARGGVVLALLLIAISRTQGHKKYPAIEILYKQLTDFSTPEELEEQVVNVNVTPVVPSRDFIYSGMLATEGFPQYPGSKEVSYTAEPQKVAATLNWFSVATGGLHSCGIRRYFNDTKHPEEDPRTDFSHANPDDAPGQMRCWGMNDFGQVHPMPLPFGEPTPSDVVKCTTDSKQEMLIGYINVNEVLPGEKVQAVRLNCWDWDDGWRNISAGWLHTCGILADGRLICWGNNDYGEMGNLLEPSLLMEGEPICGSEDAISNKCISKFKGKFALTEFGGVAAGKRQTCAIKCVDDDNPDKPPDHVDVWYLSGTKMPWPTTPPATCTQGKVVCWGDDRLGQAAGGFAKAAGGVLKDYDDFISVCSASSHSCAVRKEGNLHCWGHDGNNRARVPQRLINRKWRGVKCRGAHTCAITVQNQINRSSLECWGHNGHTQSIVPTFAKQVLVPIESSTVPIIRKEIYERDVQSFDVGDMHTCAIWSTTYDERNCDLNALKPPSRNGECWGENSYGQTNFDINFQPYGWAPEKICSSFFYSKVSTGSLHTCGITVDDVGQYCFKDSQCDEYPPPLCQPRCMENNPPRLEGSAYNVCPRHIPGGRMDIPRVKFRTSAEIEFDKSSDVCVPTRTNHLRCWGLDSHLQNFVPGLWDGASDAWRLSASLATTLTLAALTIALSLHQS